MSTPPATILIADIPEGIEVFGRALTSTFTLVPVNTLEQARRALQQPPAVVVCGCHFDEGGMYDLLRHMKATAPLARVPFVAIRAIEGELDDTLYQSVKIAVRALGGDAFVDLMRWQRKHGAPEAAHRLTELLVRLAQAPHADTA